MFFHFLNFFSSLCECVFQFLRKLIVYLFLISQRIEINIQIKIVLSYSNKRMEEEIDKVENALTIE